MHATGAFLVVDHELAILHPQAVGGTDIDDLFFNIKLAPVFARMGAGVWCDFAADLGL
jgi:hypothetical protein